MPHLQRDLVAEQGVLFHLCQTPEKLPQFLDWGLTADCFSHAALQTFLLCLIECQGKGITGRQGIASQLKHYDGLGAKDLAKLQGWILNPPEPTIDSELAIGTLTALRTFNKAKSIAYDFFDNVRPITVRQNLPGLVDYLTNLDSDVQKSARPTGILESNQLYSDFESTGYTGLDELLKWPGYNKGGLRKPWLITVTMPSKQGKSTLGCNLAVNLAKQGLATIFFSMEMDRRRILSWMISPLALIRPDMALREELCGEYDYKNRRDAIAILDENVRIYDGRFTIPQMAIRIRAHQQELGEKVFLIVIDRFELIAEEKGFDKRGDWKQADDRADALLGLAQQTNTCILILNQMATDAAEKWNVSMSLPSLKILRGGQGLFNASDVIIAGGRHPGQENGILMLEKQLCTVLHVKAVRDIGFDLGKTELRFVPEYKRLEEGS